MRKLSRSKWPAYLAKYKSLKGIHVGGCVGGKHWHVARYMAHAHLRRKSLAHGGWICLNNARLANDRELMLHELAHVLTNERHTKKFFARLSVLHGGTLPENEAVALEHFQLTWYMRGVTKEGMRPGRERYFLLRDEFLRTCRKHKAASDRLVEKYTLERHGRFRVLKIDRDKFLGLRRRMRRRHSASRRARLANWRQEAERLLGMGK